MFQPRTKKKPPPRPPPPNLNKFKSKSTYNLSQAIPNLIDWSPPSSPSNDNHRQFGGSISSSYSGSASSLTSSKKSLENDPLPLTQSSATGASSNSRPRIIRPLPPKKNINDSPPMPSVPPPSPPKGNHDIVTSYGIALYDFPAAQPGDLALQENDVVILIRRVNKEWLYGKVGEQEGIFPDNFIQIEVPLPGDDRTMRALYEFKPQMAGDLPLKAGDKVRIIKEISNEWFYGESNGRTGQFPKNFVF